MKSKKRKQIGRLYVADVLKSNRYAHPFRRDAQIEDISNYEACTNWASHVADFLKSNRYAHPLRRDAQIEDIRNLEGVQIGRLYGVHVLIIK
jgi:hypothetical protein